MFAAGSWQRIIELAVHSKQNAMKELFEKFEACNEPGVEKAFIEALKKSGNLC